MIVLDKFPDVNLTSWEFLYVGPSKIARMEGRVTETVYDYAGYWIFSGTFKPLLNGDASKLDAFFDRPRPFAAHHPVNCRPSAYPGDPFNGQAAMIDLSVRNTPQISGLPSGFRLTAGDLVEFRQSDTVRSLHRIDADAVADSAGLVSLSLKWPVPEPIVQADAVIFERPSCVMQVQSSRRPQGSSSTYSFEAVEVFPV